MRKLNRILLFCIVLFNAESAVAQKQDSLKLSHKEFIDIVKKYHPLAYRYRIQNKIAEEEINKARGNFDPVLAAKVGSKSIDGVDYYDMKNAGLEVPTWYGVDFNGSYNYIDGDKLNNSDTRGGLYQFGVTIPLAKNLIYDNRRAVLDQARFAQDMTEAEQKILTNELMLNADNAYWDWVRNYEIYNLQSSMVEISKNRLAFINKTLSFGETAAIDTVEAISQMQNFELKMQEAYLGYVKSIQNIQLFLWKENQEIYEINGLLAPNETLRENPFENDYAALIEDIQNSSIDNHILLQYYNSKENILNSEKRLKFQSFLPKLDFTYNFFNKDGYKADYFPMFQSNYQYGIKMEIPVFLRKARADYQIAKSKILQNKLDTDYKRKELETKIEAYKNEVLIYHNQIDISEKNIANYRRLLAAEETRYGNGESSLFLINNRKNKLIDAQEKNIELRLKFLKGLNNLKWLNEGFK